MLRHIMRMTVIIPLAIILFCGANGCRTKPEGVQRAATRGGMIDLIELSRVADGRSAQRQARYERELAEEEKNIAACEFSGKVGDLPWRLLPDSGSGSPADGLLGIPSAGEDARVLLKPDLDCGAVREIHLRMRASAGQWGRIFWRTSENQRKREGSQRFQLISGDSFQTYTIEVGGHEAWHGRLAEIELAPADTTGRVEIDFIRFCSGLPPTDQSLLQALHRVPGAALAIAGDRRPIMRVLPGTPLDLTFEPPAGDQAPLLSFAVGIAKPGWQGRGNPVRFSVQAIPDGGNGRATIFERILNPRRRQADRGWVSARLSLAPYAGRAVTLRFSVDDIGGKGSASCAVWANPMVAAAHASRTNVLVILVDALRADRLGYQGSAHRLSPHIDRWSRRGTCFSAAYAASSWTVPSVASIFTGLYPYEHGVRYLNTLSLDQRFATIAEQFRDAGYFTSAISDNQLISPANGFAQGFLSFNSISRRAQERKARRITNLAAARLVEIADRPFFLYVHYMDPHGPYQPAAPFCPEVPADSAGMLPQVKRGQSEWLNLQRIRNHSFRISPSERAHLVRLYEGEIAFTDFHIGRLLARLEALGLRDRTVVVLLADHGEEFAERGSFSHGTSLHEEQIHIPLFIIDPVSTLGAGPYRVDRPVRTVDLVEMLVGATGLGGEAPKEGRPTDPAGGRQADVRPAGVYSELNPLTSGPFADGGFSASRIVLQGGYKLFFAPASDSYRLFDLARDPGERNDLFDENHPVALDLMARLASHLEAGASVGAGDAGGAVLSSEQLERLEALGYVEVEQGPVGSR